MNRRAIVLLGLLGVLVLSLIWLARTPAHAHCDTLDGPVIRDAKIALEKGDVAPVLKWVTESSEDEIRTAFNKTIAVRGKGDEVRALADTYFFETLVRIHRAGEGAPFTGLRPAGADLSPAVKGADEALERGKVDFLVELVTKNVAEGIRTRFSRVVEKRKQAERSVEAGREYVAAYVDYVHFLEGVHAATQKTHDHKEDAQKHHDTQPKEGHEHHRE